MKLVKTFVRLYIYFAFMIIFISIMSSVLDALNRDGKLFVLIKIIVNRPELLLDKDFLVSFKILGKLIIFLPAIFAAGLTLLTLGDDKKAKYENGRTGLSVSFGYKLALPAFMILIVWVAVNDQEPDLWGKAIFVLGFALMVAPIQYRLMTLEVAFDKKTLWVKNLLSGWSEYDLSNLENYNTFSEAAITINFANNKKISFFSGLNQINLLTDHLDAQIEKNKNA